MNSVILFLCVHWFFLSTFSSYSLVFCWLLLLGVVGAFFFISSGKNFSSFSICRTFRLDTTSTFGLAMPCHANMYVFMEKVCVWYSLFDCYYSFCMFLLPSDFISFVKMHTYIRPRSIRKQWTTHPLKRNGVHLCVCGGLWTEDWKKRRRNRVRKETLTAQIKWNIGSDRKLCNNKKTWSKARRLKSNET